MRAVQSASHIKKMRLASFSSLSFSLYSSISFIALSNASFCDYASPDASNVRGKILSTYKDAIIERGEHKKNVENDFI